MKKSKISSLNSTKSRDSLKKNKQSKPEVIPDEEPSNKNIEQAIEDMKSTQNMDQLQQVANAKLGSMNIHENE